MNDTRKTACGYRLPRRGNTLAECWDALALDEPAGRYAVADGASESPFAGLWAKILVEGFAEKGKGDVEQWAASLPALQERFNADIRGREIPFHARAGVKKGAFATFLGLVVSGMQWQAVAVGDACLLHTRGDALLRAFPIEHSQQFGSVPQLVGSRMPVDDIGKRQSLWLDGHGQPGDTLWMATDALAQCCLAEHESGGRPWGALESLLGEPASSERFAAWIEELRDSGRLRNDDVALLAISVQEK